MSNDSDKKRLSVLLINNYFPPEVGAASHLYYYLAKELLNRGHEVTVLTGIPSLLRRCRPGKRGTGGCCRDRRDDHGRTA